VNEEVLRLARVVWEYHHLRHEAIPGDVIIALGTNDLRVAEFAADLYHRGYGSTLVCTGGAPSPLGCLLIAEEETEISFRIPRELRPGVPLLRTPLWRSWIVCSCGRLDLLFGADLFLWSHRWIQRSPFRDIAPEAACLS
jgi:hypothetical protein